MLISMQDYTVAPLNIGYRSGGERLLLWLPMTITHIINEESPLFNWKDPNEALQDCDATIVVWVCSLTTAHTLAMKSSQLRIALTDCAEWCFGDVVHIHSQDVSSMSC